MDDHSPRRTSGDTLRREVEPPQRQPTGLGVMLLASAAMFFAVAGSAFILRARMANDGCPYRSRGAVTAPAPRQSDMRPAPAHIRYAKPPPADCVTSHTAPDGSQVYEFKVCPE
jgi:hypothetical protein